MHFVSPSLFSTDKGGEDVYLPVDDNQIRIHPWGQATFAGQPQAYRRVLAGQADGIVKRDACHALRVGDGPVQGEDAAGQRARFEPGCAIFDDDLAVSGRI